MRLSLLIMAIFLALCGRIQAQGFTGIDLYKVCADPNADTLCLGYIRGFSEGYYLGLFYGARIERAHQRPCYPQPPIENPDPTQAELIVKKYMTDHPEELNKPASLVIAAALGNAFDCPK